MQGIFGQGGGMKSFSYRDKIPRQIKVLMCEIYVSNPNISQKDIAKMFSVAEQTVCNITSKYLGDKHPKYPITITLKSKI